MGLEDVIHGGFPLWNHIQEIAGCGEGKTACKGNDDVQYLFHNYLHCLEVELNTKSDSSLERIG